MKKSIFGSTCVVLGVSIISVAFTNCGSGKVKNNLSSQQPKANLLPINLNGELSKTAITSASFDPITSNLSLSGTIKDRFGALQLAGKLEYLCDGSKRTLPFKIPSGSVFNGSFYGFRLKLICEAGPNRITFPDQTLQMLVAGKRATNSLTTSGVPPTITLSSGEPDIAEMLEQIQANARTNLEGYGATDIVCPRLVPGTDFNIPPGFTPDQTKSLLESLVKCSARFGGFTTSNDNGFINPFELSRCEDAKSKGVAALSVLDSCEKAWAADMSFYQCANSLNRDRTSYNVSPEITVESKRISTQGGYNSYLTACRQALNLRNSFERTSEEYLKLLENNLPGLYFNGERSITMSASLGQNHQHYTGVIENNGLSNCGEFPADCVCGSSNGFIETLGSGDNNTLTLSVYKNCDGKKDGDFVDQDPTLPDPPVVEFCSLTPKGTTIIAYSVEIQGFAIMTSAGCD